MNKKQKTFLGQMSCVLSLLAAFIFAFMSTGVYQVFFILFIVCAFFQLGLFLIKENKEE
ncbi:hypothetical protein R4Y45_06960 [Holzapfeliella sp. He02]|uniref:Uncharacterized protein n=1 Tax=Holzapfeliella saturejae TaxID=3082953 RepID=A0ABU8SHU4_9LACO